MIQRLQSHTIMAEMEEHKKASSSLSSELPCEVKAILLKQLTSYMPEP